MSFYILPTFSSPSLQVRECRLMQDFDSEWLKDGAVLPTSALFTFSVKFHARLSIFTKNN